MHSPQLPERAGVFWTEPLISDTPIRHPLQGKELRVAKKRIMELLMRGRDRQMTLCSIIFLLTVALARAIVARRKL